MAYSISRNQNGAFVVKHIKRDIELRHVGRQGPPGSGGGGTGIVESVVAGSNVSVDSTDPANPIVSATASGSVESVVAGTNVTVDNTDPANPVVSSSGGPSTNYYLPQTSETFTASAGASDTFTLTEENEGVLIVFLNGQQLQDSEWSESGEDVTVTPAEGVLLSTDKITIIHSTTNAIGGESTVQWGEIEGNLSDQLDLQDALDNAGGGGGGAVDSVNGQTGVVVLDQDDVGDGTNFKQYSSADKTKLAGIEAAADVTDAGNVGSSINGATGKTTPVDADTIPLIDSAASNVLKKLTWANLKATAKTYFDTLYAAVSHTHAESDITNLTTDLGNKQPLDSDLTSIAGLTPTNDDVVQRKAGAWTNRSMSQVKTDLVLVKGDVGLGSVDNTSDASKPVSTAQQNALNLKADLASPTFTGTVVLPTTNAGGKIAPTTDDGAALGDGTHQFSDLFIASGGVLNFNNGDVTLTHSSNVLTLAGGTLVSADHTVTTGSAIRTATSAGNTLLLRAFDVDGAAYTTFATLTANNTPTMDLDDAVTKAGQYIYRAGGTDVPLTDGGTGASDASTARTNLGLGTIAVLAAPSGTVVGTTDTQTLTNKDLSSGTNTFPTLNQNTTGKSAKTDALNSATTVVDVAAATAPSAGQALIATDSTHATWQSPIELVATFALGGILTVKTGAFRWYADRSLTIVECRASVGTQPTGASVIIDVNKNGTTAFTTQGNRPEIAVSTNTDGSNVPDVTSLADGDYLTIDIDQIGSTIAGADLTVQIRMR